MKSNRIYLLLLWFAVVLLSADCLWKCCVREEDGEVRLLKQQVTPFFSRLAEHTAYWAYNTAHLFKRQLRLENNVKLTYPNGNSTWIGWSCTPVKQQFIFVCLLLLTPPIVKSRAWHKCWYIPVCLLLLYGVNILRIATIAVVIDTHPEWFDILHTYLLKYVFYGVVFALWMMWVKLSATERNVKTHKN